MVAFNQIPDNLRVPLFYAEFDNTRAVSGGASQQYKTLMVGQKLASGTHTALDPVVITSAEQAYNFFGAGSMIADMASKYLEGNRSNQLTCVALDDDAAGVAAEGVITLGGAPTAAGILNIMVGGREY